MAKGTVYNSLWTTQVLQLDSKNKNIAYSQTLSLTPGTNYKLQLSCAAKAGKPLDTSGFLAMVNTKTVVYQQKPVNYSICTFSADFSATTVSNILKLQGLGKADKEGTSCDNVAVYEIVYDSHRTVSSGGLCICMDGYYPIDNNAIPTCSPCPLASPHCITCTNIDTSGTGTSYVFTCTRCEYSYFVSGASCLPCTDILLVGCLDCLNPITNPTLYCTTCDTDNNFVDLYLNGTCMCD